MKEKAAVGAGGGILGVAIGFMADPAKGLEVMKWLDKSLGPVGFVSLLFAIPALTIAVTTNWVLFKYFTERAKEKDAECAMEQDRQRNAWKAVVDSKEEDNRAIAGAVNKLLIQVTMLTERMAHLVGMQTRSPG